MNELKEKYPLSAAIGKRRRNLFRADYAYAPDLYWRRERFELKGLHRSLWGTALKNNFKHDEEHRCFWTLNPKKAAIFCRQADETAREKMEAMLLAMEGKSDAEEIN